MVKRYLSCTCLYSVSSDQSPDSVPYSLSLGVMIMPSCSANHLMCVTSASVASLACLSVPYSPPSQYLLVGLTLTCTPPAPVAVYYCSTVSLSDLLLQDHTESVFSHPFHSIVLSMVPDLCIDYLNIPNIWEKLLSYVFYGIGKWILINTVQLIESMMVQKQHVTV